MKLLNLKYLKLGASRDNEICLIRKILFQDYKTERGVSVVMHGTRILGVTVSIPGADQSDCGFFHGFPQFIKVTILSLHYHRYISFQKI